MSKLKEEYSYSLDIYMDLIGWKWKLRILYHLSNGTKRFGELKKLLGSITEKTLTQQLRELEQDKLIIRTVYNEVPPRVEYSMAEYCTDLLPIFKEICIWSIKYAKDNNIQINS